MMSSFQHADRLDCLGENIWAEFSQLNRIHKPTDLGMGFPNFAPPEHLTKALAETTLSESIHQYTRGFGHPRLVNVLGKLYSKLTGREINAQDEIITTIGADEAIFCTINAFINPGDEVIIIEPFYDVYQSITRVAGGVPVFIPLRPKENQSGGKSLSQNWVLDANELEKKFSKKTKMMIVNTPNNPLGKVYSREELEMIANVCSRHDVIIVMDEVYEWMIYDDAVHTRMASLPGTWNRTITIGSAGKSFGITGWKVGWAYGPKHLIFPLQMVHQNFVSSMAAPLQEAVAVGFETELERINTKESFWKVLNGKLEEKRNKLASFLSSVSMSPIIGQGGYFMVVDISLILENDKVDLSHETGSKDYRFARWLLKNKKLIAIPVSNFYSDQHKSLGESYIRFCFCKTDVTLKSGEQIINNLKKSLM